MNNFPSIPLAKKVCALGQMQALNRHSVDMLLKESNRQKGVATGMAVWGVLKLNARSMAAKVVEFRSFNGMQPMQLLGKKGLRFFKLRGHRN